MNNKLLSLVAAITTTLVMGLAIKSNASDIEIYSDVQAGKVTLFMMLDTSGSMGYGYNYSSSPNSVSSLVQDYGVCEWDTQNQYTSDVVAINKTYQVGTGNIKSYVVHTCHVNQAMFNQLSSTYQRRIQSECEPSSEIDTFPYICYDRLARLKMALVNALSGDEISNTTRLGIGEFSSPNSNSAYSRDGVSGRIIYPVVELTPSNREILLDYIVQLDAYDGTPSAAAYAESAAYLLGSDVSVRATRPWAGSGSVISYLTNSGYPYSIASSKSNIDGHYQAALTDADLVNTCNGQGIYFLTDGFANSSSSRDTQALMNRTISLSGTGLSGGTSDAGWKEIGQFSKLLRTQKNIKTAVVGFGSAFPNTAIYIKRLTNNRGLQTSYYNCEQLSGEDLKNTCNWGAKDRDDVSDQDKHQLPASVGGFGNGGFYSAQSIDDLVDSIVNFIEDIQPNLIPLSVGAPTIPVDSLNAMESRPHGYYSAFVAKPSSKVTLWLGNVNKYDVYNGQLGVGTTESSFQRLITDEGTLDDSVDGLWAGGVRGQLPLGTSSSGESKRIIFSNRIINDDGIATETDSLQQVDLNSIFSGDVSQAKFKFDPLKNYLLNLLGYQVAANDNIEQVADLPVEETRQVGAVMHSSPILLTQEGRIVTVDGTVTTTDRKDYLLFGSNQGIVHVTDDSGKEILAFVPHEIIEKQYDGFMIEGNTSGGKNNLYYGMDGPWTAFTQYVRRDDGTYTVAKSNRTIDDEDIEFSGLQWVYGGMRMGGRSYYALDLSDIENPELKFHINPDAAAASNDALSYMGQSWSKPTLGYVNWGGDKTLVMFVGGGYDAGYEESAYIQDNQKGAGVYMFNANTGELLWWGSANATSDMGAEQHTEDSNLKYSVVSQINAVDRDNDGLIDNLYFGDLGGQVFRIDLNNTASGATASAKKQKFLTRITRLHDAHLDDGLSPRFYQMPSFSVHNGEQGLFAVIALTSGNRSSPLAGQKGKNANDTGSADDGLFVLYDNDVGRSDLYASNFVATELAGGFKNNNNLLGVAQKQDNAYHAGWKYSYSEDNHGQIKGLEELFAMDSMLYVNLYDRDGEGIRGQCGSAVKGESYVYQFCLPTGKCDFYQGLSQNIPNRTRLGPGILGAGFGQDHNNSGGGGLVVPRTDSQDCTNNPNSPECQMYSTSAELRQLRWYESTQ